MLTFPTWVRWSRIGRVYARGLIRMIGEDRARAFLTAANIELIDWTAHH
jgi:hypothetical protein